MLRGVIAGLAFLALSCGPPKKDPPPTLTVAQAGAILTLTGALCAVDVRGCAMHASNNLVEQAANVVLASLREPQSPEQQRCIEHCQNDYTSCVDPVSAGLSDTCSTDTIHCYKGCEVALTPASASAP